MRRSFTLLLALLMAAMMTIPALATGNVTYEGEAQKFIFTPGSEYSPTDLFENFKDVMPGDSIEQSIVVRNTAGKMTKVKIYIRALGAHEDSVEFLSQMNLTVIQKEDTELFNAPADQTAQLTDWVCLGTFYSDAEVELAVRLDVPLEMGNDFQAAVGYLDWQFKVEEFPLEPGDPGYPQTGDYVIFWAVTALAVSSAGITVLVLFGKRRKNRQ